MSFFFFFFPTEATLNEQRRLLEPFTGGEKQALRNSHHSGEAGGRGHKDAPSLWLVLFKTTRWTPGPGRSRNGTAPAREGAKGLYAAYLNATCKVIFFLPPIESGAFAPPWNSFTRSQSLTGVSTMLGLLFLRVLTAWKTSTTLCLLAISHTMLLAQNTPLRPPPFLSHARTHARHNTTRRVPVRKMWRQNVPVVIYFLALMLGFGQMTFSLFMRYNWGEVKIWIMQISVWTQFDLISMTVFFPTRIKIWPVFFFNKVLRLGWTLFIYQCTIGRRTYLLSKYLSKSINIYYVSFDSIW